MRVDTNTALMLGVVGLGAIAFFTLRKDAKAFASAVGSTFQSGVEGVGNTIEAVNPLERESLFQRTARLITRAITGTVQLAGTVKLPSGELVSNDEIQDAGGFEFSADGQTATFRWEGQTYTISSDRDETGARIAR